MRLLKLLTVVLTFAIFLASCKSAEKLEWPTTGISTILPEPQSKSGSIHTDRDESFIAEVSISSSSEYESYKKTCIDNGFTIDSKDSNYGYEAYNTEGYRLSLSYWSSNNSFSIDLDAPKERTSISWPSMGLSAIIPKPISSIGKIVIDSSERLYAYVCDMSIDDFNIYSDEFIKSGFNVDYDKTEKVFSAQNDNGDKVHLSYIGFNTVDISVYKSKNTDDHEQEDPEEPIYEETTNTTEPDAAETTVIATTTEATTEKRDEEKTVESLVEGIRPEFKEAIDSYEKFFDKYCSFMKKYKESPDDLSLLADYTQYLTQYSETMEKMDALDDGDLNDAETKYYIEVTARINQKLIEAAL